MDEQDWFLGTWELIPELSLYEAGSAPAAGTYVIAERDGLVQVEIHWRMEPDGAEQRTSFAAPADGSPQPLAAGTGAGPDAFSLTRVDEWTLDSAALREGQVVAFARRVASRDGKLLAVVQEAGSGGTRARNFQVYRRIDGGHDPMV
jgi:hypothetical protein